MMNHHDKHGKRHRARDPFEDYVFEHMLHIVDKVPNKHRAKPHFHEKVSNDCFDKGRSMQHNLLSPILYENAISNKNIDAKAEEFIMLKHEKFELTK
ncbi:hypothetical protein BUALT_Bualt17G0033900 [Buddleja alternifolia]|uniref:Uncharacterized protein n=1 Tax=Buddleja alternifolia TaxID=168488 RepID=A0AAV6WF48_9LAMI|nr:hypothetical protein BUALT_Bualt17G0033900 [Buddleja alternifolia]